MAIAQTVAKPDTFCDFKKGTAIYDSDGMKLRNSLSDHTVQVVSTGPKYVGIRDPKNGSLVFLAKVDAKNIRVIPASSPEPTIEQCVNTLFARMAEVVIAQAKEGN